MNIPPNLSKFFSSGTSTTSATYAVLLTFTLMITTTTVLSAATPLMHSLSNLSPQDYARGDLREKDVIQRQSPSLTQELAKHELKLGSPVFIRIFKESRELELWVLHPSSQKFRLFKTWSIAAMSGSLGPKVAQGDLQAPEGFYYVPSSGLNPNSRYHLSFNIGYPNSFDRAHRRTGSLIMVHGNRVSIGCFAMTDISIEEIYTLCAAALTKGQKFFRVHSFPFRMTNDRLKKEKQNPHYAFWRQLKPGYDWFENKQSPPDVTVSHQTYQFK